MAGGASAPRADASRLEDTLEQEVAGEQAADAPAAAPRPGGRRYTNGRPPASRTSAEPWSSQASWQPGARPAPFPARLAAFGTVAGLLTACLVCCLGAVWLHVDAVAGLGFCAATCFAVRFARREALLGLVVSLPAVFLAAAVLTQLATMPSGAHRGTLLLVLEGTVLTLAGVAPWLFLGTVAGVVIAMFRGLPRCVRELRSDLNGRRPASRPLRNRIGRLARLAGGPLAQFPRKPERHPLGHRLDLHDIPEPVLS
jgi:hypothetical protein